MVTSTSQKQLTERELAAVMWAAADKVATKEVDRSALPTDEPQEVRLMITGEIDGQTVHRSVLGTLRVGADQERAVSATPDQATLVALILSKLNTATRDKILADLPRQFADNGDCWPMVAPDIVESTEQMLRDIRSQKTVEVRGNVRFAYEVAKQAPNRHQRRQSELRNHRPSKPRCRESRHCNK